MDKADNIADWAIAFGWVAVSLSLVGLVWVSFHPTHDNPEFYFKGKSYAVVGLQGAGYTREHRSPVYTLVVMTKEDTKQWTKK